MLVKESERWHPDRFAKCREDVREEVQKMAKEMFQIIRGFADQARG
jgi:hypothetical protein